MRNPMKENSLVALLTPPTRRSLECDLRPVHLTLDSVLRSSAGMPVVFPRTSVISIVTRTGDGQTLDNALIGYEGVFVEQPEAPNVQGIVQIAGDAYCLTETAFEKHLDNREFRHAVNRHQHRLMSFACQSAICQAFHTAEQRLARWLLSLQDRTDDAELQLTQEFLASMLGVHRPTVTIAARVLQAAGMIHYRYGRISIADREALEEAACECYRMVPSPSSSED
jgi:CRP-like cAMP-binding protein